MSKWFPETVYQWRRLKLLWAELLVVGLARGEHSLGYVDRLICVANEIEEFRELYYPEQREAGSPVASFNE
jgi:hypothetical protein